MPDLLVEEHRIGSYGALQLRLQLRFLCHHDAPDLTIRTLSRILQIKAGLSRQARLLRLLRHHDAPDL
jgi:hypothetical protein